MKEFKIGDKDPYIKLIQRTLGETLKINIAADGDFGSVTAGHLRTWQGKNGLAQTGTFDGPTAGLMTAYIERRFLKESDFNDAAVKIGVEVACVKAVQLVESRGSGYLADGRQVILFERHWFFKLLNEKLTKQPNAAKEICGRLQLSVAAGQSFDAVLKAHLIEKYGDIYAGTPGGYRGGAAEHDRIERAKAIDLECALQSASWGLFQIMGFHFKTLGYNGVRDMVADYDIGERQQLLSFCDFIRADNRLLSSLKNKDWATFAKAYNGPGYATNRYDIKMANAYLEAKSKP